MGGRGGGSGFSVRGETSAFDINGRTIDLSDSPLRYGQKDQALSAKARASVERFEEKHRLRKVEYALHTDADGNTIEEKRGGKKSVGTSIQAHMTSAVFTHIHPRPEGGVIGGTFSAQDIDNFVRFGQTTYRAAATEGTYSISKGSNFDGRGLLNYFQKERATALRELRTATNALDKQYKNKSISYDEYLKGYERENNRYLVKGHDALIAGAQKYGYAYTLERRQK